MADDKKKTKQRIKPKWDINPYLFLLWLFRKTEDDIINEVLRGYTMGYNASAEVAAMANVQSILQAMTDDCFKAVPKMIEKAFLKEMGTGATVETLTGSQNVMIETLSDTVGTFGKIKDEDVEKSEGITFSQSQMMRDPMSGLI